jgi:hypothetical protein
MPLIVRDPNLANTPPGWAACEEALGRFTPPADLGFVGSAGDLNRFRSRYRLAKSFRNIELESYRDDTAAGYSSLFRAFLVFSAFEQFLAICGTALADTATLLAAYDPEATERAIRAVPGHEDLLRFILERLDGPAYRSHVTAFLTRGSCNVLYLAASIRHIFAHGELTPHSGAGSPYTASEVSRLLCALMFQMMDGEFSRRLRDHGVAA